jgi:hypothetical protein
MIAGNGFNGACLFEILQAFSAYPRSAAKPLPKPLRAICGLEL